MLLLIFFLVIVTWVLCYQDCVKPRKFPPGPHWLPLIGAFPVFQRLRKKRQFVHLAFEELAEIYGPIVGIKLGRQKFVVVSGNDLVRKLLLSDELNGRPDGFFFRVRSFGKRIGVLFSDGPTWSKTRRTTTRHLRSFGFGQQIIGKFLKIEAEEIISHLCNHVNKTEKPFPMCEAFDAAVFNSIWTLMTGHRISSTDPRLEHIMPVIHDAFRSNDALGGIISHLPFLRFVIPELSGYNHLMSILDKLWRFIGEEIDQQVKNLDVDQQPKNFIQAFIAESGEEFDKQELVVICLDLFMAGTKTTADSLSAIFALLLHHPNWQNALQNDLDGVLGRENLPTLEHMSLLPRVEAFLAEALRILDLVPLGLPHKTMEDVSLEGYHIPKDTVILLNYRSAHFDKSCWEKPEEFHPERFLDENGGFRRKTEYLPFGLGKRRCLGETLAKPTIFLLFTYIIHCFRLQASEEHGLPRLDGIDGFVVSPRPYMVHLTPRM